MLKSTRSFVGGGFYLPSDEPDIERELCEGAALWETPLENAGLAGRANSNVKKEVQVSNSRVDSKLRTKDRTLKSDSSFKDISAQNSEQSTGRAKSSALFASNKPQHPFVESDDFVCFICGLSRMEHSCSVSPRVQENIKLLSSMTNHSGENVSRAGRQRNGAMNNAASSSVLSSVGSDATIDAFNADDDAFSVDASFQGANPIRPPKMGDVHLPKSGSIAALIV